MKRRVKKENHLIYKMIKKIYKAFTRTIHRLIYIYIYRVQKT